MAYLIHHITECLTNTAHNTEQHYRYHSEPEEHRHHTRSTPWKTPRDPPKQNTASTPYRKSSTPSSSSENQSDLNNPQDLNQEYQKFKKRIYNEQTLEGYWAGTDGVVDSKNRRRLQGEVATARAGDKACEATGFDGSSSNLVRFSRSRKSGTTTTAFSLGPGGGAGEAPALFQDRSGPCW